MPCDWTSLAISFGMHTYYLSYLYGKGGGRLAPPPPISWVLTGSNHERFQLQSPVQSLSVMVQAGYWLNRPLRIPERFGHHVLIGHLANFAGRLNMILVSGIFAATFIIRFDMVNPSIINAILLLFVLFSAFLYTQELERLGRSLVK